MVGHGGNVVWIYDKAVPVQDEAGVTTLYGHCLDITPRREIEAEPVQDEDTIQAAIASMPGAVYLCACDAVGTVKFVSTQIEDLVGYPASDFIENKVRTYDSVIYEEDLPYVVADVNDAVERGSPYSLEYRVVHVSGEPRWVAEHGRPVFGPDGRARWTAGIILDITRQKAAERSRELFERQSRRQTLHDSLTGLPSRVLFRESVAQAINGEAELAVLVMNLDRFKEVNDTLGRETGDGLLQEVGDRLRNVLREGDSVARLESDEFAVLVPEASRAQALEVINRVRGAIDPPFQLEGLALHMELSIGIACYPRDGLDADSLLRCADTAMYVAKDTKLGHAFYDASVDTRASKRLALIGELRRAIDEHELVLHWQPKLAVRGGHVLGVEALVRWQDPERGLVMPDEFIPAARETSIIKAVTQMVLEEAARQWRAWADEGRNLPVAVNLSMRDLVDPGLPGEIAMLLSRWRMPAAMLKLEVTETSIFSDPHRTEDVLERLGAMGLRLSVDDFGTGCSSLASLKRLPIDEIKIDGSFVSAMSARDEDEIIVRSMIELAHSLGLSVVAEGVEKRAVIERLAELGCDVAQGYYLCRPVPSEELAIWLDQHPDSGAAVARKRKFREEPARENLASA
jgi:diguanylate cyclase (GGDEF)-like protein/PAS domain S-box-containing protein